MEPINKLHFSPDAVEPTGGEPLKQEEVGKVCEICQSSDHVTLDHSEKGESGVEFVAVEKLVPGIDTEEIYDKNLGDKFRERVERYGGGGHRDQNVQYTYDFSSLFDSILKHAEKETRNLDIINRLKDQVIVDLGAGSVAQMYNIALEIGSKGYVGVDLWYADTLKRNILDGLKSDGFISKKSEKIPITTIGEDILTFLRRLPNKSVSVVAFGLGNGILPDDYRAEVSMEILRVLDPKGVAIIDRNSNIYIENTIDSEIKSNSERMLGTFNTFINFTDEQRIEMAKILDDFRNEIKTMDKTALKIVEENIRKEIGGYYEKLNENNYVLIGFQIEICNKKERLVYSQKSSLARP